MSSEVLKLLSTPKQPSQVLSGVLDFGMLWYVHAEGLVLAAVSPVWTGSPTPASVEQRRSPHRNLPGSPPGTKSSLSFLTKNTK